MADTTDNAFLGGRLRVLQPARGYRAGMDPVLLAAAVPAHPGQSVLELGCGVGTGVLCLGARVSGLHLAGVEVQAAYVGLARLNAARNGAEIAIHHADITELPASLKAQNFDHVLANPPFFQRASSHPSQDVGRETGRGETLALARWVEVAAKRLKPGGRATFIQRAERLPELLTACTGRLGSLEVLPLLPRQGRAARLVLLRGRKGGGAAFCLHAGVVLHRGERHLRDGDDYSPLISDVLRNGAALPFDAAA